MQEVFEKIIDRLERNKIRYVNLYTEGDCKGSRYFLGKTEGIDISQKIVKAVVTEYNNGWIPCSEILTELLGYWNHSLPEKVDYADLVGAPAFAHGKEMVYEDEYGYMVEDTIKALEELQQYKDTGLTSEQIREIDKLYAEKCKELAETEDYIKWLENMTILLSKCYQETHEMLLRKMKEGNKAYLDMPTVQGFEMSMYVDKISKKALNSGTISSEKLESYADYLIERNPVEAILAEMEN